MKKIKSTTKTILSKLVSLSLVAVIVFTGISSTAVSARAAVVTVPTISAGEQWSGSWSDQVEYNTIELDVEETSFYTITITDHKQMGYVGLVIIDKQTQIPVFYVDLLEHSEGAEPVIINTFTTQEFYLAEGRKYDLMCGYFDNDYNNLDAEASISLNKSDFEPLELPNCSALSSNVIIQHNGQQEWFRFKTGEAGDYKLNCSPNNLNMSIVLYSSETGEAIDLDFTEKYDEWTNEFVYSQPIFNLKSDTTYYFSISGYNVGASCRLSVTKCPKDIKSIEIYEPLYSFYSSWGVNDVSYECFRYKLTYTDNTTVLPTYTNIWEMGYDLPNIKYVGEELIINDSYFLAAGTQPIEVTYNGITTTAYIQIGTLFDFVRYNPKVNESVNVTIGYIYDEMYTEFCRVNMEEDGIYGLWSYSSDTFATNFKNYAIVMVDDQNNIIGYDAENEGWPLYANEEYVLCFSYQYNESCLDNDITFWFQKEADLYTGWTKIDYKWYYCEKGYIVINCWKRDSKGWVYLGQDGTMTKSKWVLSSGKWYYCDANGYMVVNKWMKDSKGWVYLGDDGAVVTNKWLKDSKGWCYVGANGYCLTNQWKKDSHGWIYLDANGSMTKAKWVLSSGKWYYCDANGYMVSNKWMKDSKGWVYLGADGAMVTNKWVKDSKGWCYVGANGYAVTNQWKKDSHGWIYLNSNGSMTKSKWVLSSGKWYYCDANGYMVANKSLKIGSKTYKFNASGVCTNP